MTALGGVAVKANGQISVENLKHLTPLGAVIWWGDATTAPAFDQALAVRDRPILALITEHPDSAHVLFEQHVCFDTSAAGGNAALLRSDSCPPFGTGHRPSMIPIRDTIHLAKNPMSPMC